MTREEIILAALSSGKGASHSPVQIQKLLFLADRRVASLVGGPFFNFAPYDYGPFDRSIYDDLITLNKQGLVEVIGDPSSKVRRYKLSEAGQAKGEQLLSKEDKRIQQFFAQLSSWVRALSFAQLVSAVYQAYPEMRENSVFGR